MKLALDWESMSHGMRVLLLLSVLSNVASFYIFCMVGGQCFETIDITTDYRGPPLNGSFMAMIKPVGWAGMVLQGLSWLFYQAFAMMLTAKANEIQRDMPQGLPPVGNPIPSIALQSNAAAWGGHSNAAGRSIPRAGTLPAPASHPVCERETSRTRVRVCLRAFAYVCGGGLAGVCLAAVFMAMKIARLTVLVPVVVHVCVSLPDHMPSASCPLRVEQPPMSPMQLPQGAPMQFANATSPQPMQLARAQTANYGAGLY